MDADRLLYAARKLQELLSITQQLREEGDLNLAMLVAVRGLQAQIGVALDVIRAHLPDEDI